MFLYYRDQTVARLYFGKTIAKDAGLLLCAYPLFGYTKSGKDSANALPTS